MGPGTPKPLLHVVWGLLYFLVPSMWRCYQRMMWQDISYINTNEKMRKSGRLLVAHGWRWEKEKREGCDGVSAWRAKMVMYDLDSQNIRYISHHSSESAPRFYILYFMFNISRPSSKSGLVFFVCFLVLKHPGFDNNLPLISLLFAMDW